MRRIPLWLALLLIAPLLASGQPHIVFVLADDLGWNDVGYHGSDIRTPHIDSLVEQGLELHRYYAFPLCSPTRAALLTGRSPLRMGVDTPIGPRGALPLDEHLLPESLRAAGYQTFLTGKWHLGIDRVSAHPYRRGFDSSYGHLGASVDYFTHVWIGGLDWHRDGTVLREEGYSTDLIADEAVRLIAERDKTRPMFLYVAFNAPHAPLQATEEYLSRNVHIEESDRRTYAAMVTALDDGVGRIVAALDAEGIGSETILIWASDNGGGRGTGASNLPFRGAKGSALEGGIRVPAVMRWPGVLPEGERFDQMITVQDWFPTLASAAGFETENERPFDGLDMWEALRRGERVDRGTAVVGVSGNLAVFRDGWKFVQLTQRGTGQTETFLFRIEDDPREERDLSDAEPERARELMAWLEEFPRAPSVSGFRPQGAGGGGNRRRGRGPRAASEQSAPTGPSWIERAIKD